MTAAPPEAGPLERERELATLAELVEGARSGRGATALVTGPAGIGKSRLLDAAAGHAAAAGATVLRARGIELERESPFGVVRQLFEPLLRDAAERERVLAGGAAPARAVFEPLPDAGADPSFAALHGLYWMTANLSGERPLVLAVDDLHWCDRSSLRFLAYLARRVDDLPVLVVATLRPADLGTDAVLTAELADDPRTVTIEPGPLGAAGVRPETASRAALDRIARLPADAPALARASAVLGDGADPAVAAAVAELTEPAAREALAALRAAEVLRADAPLAFVHPFVRDAVYREIADEELGARHGRAARVLADAGASPDQVAAHLLAMPAGGDPWVVDALAAAARAALGRGAAESAVAYLRRALDEPPPDERRVEVLVALGAAEALTSGPAAAEHLHAAYDALPDAVERARLAVALCETLTFTGRFAESAAVARAASAALGAGEDELDLRRRLDVARALNAHFDPSADPDAAEPVDPEAIGDDGIGSKLLLAISAFDCARLGHPADEALALIDRAIAGDAFAAALGNAGIFALMVFILTHADRPEALTVCDAALSDAHRRGSLFAACTAHVFRGYALLHRGELAESEELLLTAFDEIETWGIEPGRSHGSAFLSDLYVDRGDIPSARRAFERAGVPDEPPPSPYLVWWLTSRVRLLLAEGRNEQALARAYDARDRLAGVIDNVAFAPWRSQAAEALAALGRAREAVALAEEEVELARRWGAPRSLGRALRILGSVHPGEGLPALEEAVTVLEGSQSRLEHARALTALGGVLRRDRRPLEAREPLRRALELAERCDARGLVEHVRTEFYATGARPPSGGPGGVGSLTASERRVVHLAAEGADSRDIAQALYLTPKTIESYEANAFRKLGIRSRRELAGVLTRL